MDSGLLNSGGTIIFDNAFFYGQTYDKDCSSEKYPKGWGVHKCNTFVAADTRVEQVTDNFTELLHIKLRVVWCNFSLYLYVSKQQMTLCRIHVLWPLYWVCIV